MYYMSLPPPLSLSLSNLLATPFWYGSDHKLKGGEKKGSDLLSLFIESFKGSILDILIRFSLLKFRNLYVDFFVNYTTNSDNNLFPHIDKVNISRNIITYSSNYLVSYLVMLCDTYLPFYRSFYK